MQLFWGLELLLCLPSPRLVCENYSLMRVLVAMNVSSFVPEWEDSIWDWRQKPMALSFKSAKLCRKQMGKSIALLA